MVKGASFLQQEQCLAFPLFLFGIKAARTLGAQRFERDLLVQMKSLLAGAKVLVLVFLSETRAWFETRAGFKGPNEQTTFRRSSPSTRQGHRLPRVSCPELRSRWPPTRWCRTGTAPAGHFGAGLSSWPVRHRTDSRDFPMEGGGHTRHFTSPIEVVRILGCQSTPRLCSSRGCKLVICDPMGMGGLTQCPKWRTPI